FVPVAIVCLWVILAGEPGNGWFHRHVLTWSSDIHVRGLVDDVMKYIPVLAFGAGLVFGFSFDTTGPVVRRAVVDRRADVAPAPVDERRAADEPLSAERSTVAPQAEDGEYAGAPAPEAPPRARAARAGRRQPPRAAATGRSRRRSRTVAARPRRLTQLLLAEDPDEEEDRAEGEPGEDHRDGLCHADCDEAEVDVHAETHGPDEGRDAAVDAGRPQVHERILGHVFAVEAHDLRRLDGEPLLVDALPRLVDGLMRPESAFPGALFELPHPLAEAFRLVGVATVGGASELELCANELPADPAQLPAGGQELAACARPGPCGSGGAAGPVARAPRQPNRRPGRRIVRTEAAGRPEEQGVQGDRQRREDQSAQPVARGQRDRTEHQGDQPEPESGERRHDAEEPRLVAVVRHMHFLPPRSESESMSDQKDSPSRFRFRPPLLLTF